MGGAKGHKIVDCVDLCEFGFWGKIFHWFLVADFRMAGVTTDFTDEFQVNLEVGGSGMGSNYTMRGAWGMPRKDFPLRETGYAAVIADFPLVSSAVGPSSLGGFFSAGAADIVHRFLIPLGIMKESTAPLIAEFLHSDSRNLLPIVDRNRFLARQTDDGVCEILGDGGGMKF
jgi:hypothetical protein